MPRLRRLAVPFAVAALLGAAAAPTALATDEPLGEHVSTCAQAALGQRDDPPAVTCAHDDMDMSFDTFGELVAHIRSTH